MEKGLLEKTGKSLSEWVDIVKKTEMEKHGEIIKYLKDEHNFTHGFANFVAIKAREADAGSQSDDVLIANQYRGKEALLEIYHELIKHIEKLGTGIEIVPKKAAVSIRAKRQFVLIKPATKTRIDLGLKFNNKPTNKRLEESGPFGSMCSHRIQLTSKDQIDEELMGWVKEAFLEAIG